MKAVIRGTVCAIALVAALTGCGSDGGTAAVGNGGGVGSGSGGGKGKASGPLTAEQLRSALPTGTDLGRNYKAENEPAVAIGGEEARKHCAETTGATCEGLVAAGAAEINHARRREGKAEFSLFSFDSPKAATAAMKSLADKKRAAIEPTPTPVEVQAGANETDAFGNNRVTAVTMRVDSVLVYVWAVEIEVDEAKAAAKLQVDRLKAVHGGH
ncbi:hypothetical protein ACFXB3_33955 [Streptomyces sp. NPDC059447]|uniref:hypothetical protein n=1 Tax=Streptomyces sp. NPDC059447 TaxID=3346834 RepID=UPI0036ADC700